MIEQLLTTTPKHKRTVLYDGKKTTLLFFTSAPRIPLGELYTRVQWKTVLWSDTSDEDKFRQAVLSLFDSYLISSIKFVQTGLTSIGQFFYVRIWVTPHQNIHDIQAYDIFLD